jgi:two-component system response regulator AtoC
MSRVLVADDERGICEAFAEFLIADGHTPVICANGKEAIQAVRDQVPDVAFVDVQMPGSSGLDALKEIRQIAPDLPVLVMTAFGTLETARKAIELGAFDYLGKPLELNQIRKLLERAMYKSQIKPAKDTVVHDDPTRLLGQSAVMQELFKKMALLASNDLAILISGESGVGKELVAKAVHDLGPNRDEPFVAVNCAAIPETLLEAELFGNEAGAFTDAKNKRIGRFEAAGNGTLFLDEVSELPYHVQSKLLRVLQERTFERLGNVNSVDFTARLIAASNRNLDTEVAEGRFRDDLYHRLNLASLVVPNLRARQDDIELLVTHFLRQSNKEMKKSISGVEPDVLERLSSYDWPGNVRELEHAIKRAVLAARGTTITSHDLELNDTAASGRRSDGLLESLSLQAAQIVNEPEQFGGSGHLYQHLMDVAGLAMIEAAMKATDGNQVAAARLLGINRSTLRKKLNDANES